MPQILSEWVLISVMPSTFHKRNSPAISVNTATHITNTKTSLWQLHIHSNLINTDRKIPNRRTPQPLLPHQIPSHRFAVSLCQLFNLSWNRLVIKRPYLPTQELAAKEEEPPSHQAKVPAKRSREKRTSLPPKRIRK
ncbi:hypothetical protein AVEN_247005-1 [Araneus ventricosus]|uniref:Uncharacterized protein n=1 Tax=Araneus ventricosus TaxID=182803 RepID=A0A4Y2JWX9_ARAVE|nr:hypothetical protein AVEN_247005-1 [Araneus ventricosus]